MKKTLKKSLALTLAALMAMGVLTACGNNAKENTETMIEADGYINTQEPVLLMPEIRQKCERWIEWANNNPDKAVGLISGT